MPAATACAGEGMATDLPWTWISPDFDRIRAKHRARDLGAPGAHQPGEAQDFAALHLETDVAHERAAVEALNLERGLLARLAPGFALRSPSARPTIMRDDRLDRSGGGVDAFRLVSPSRITVTRSAIV